MRSNRAVTSASRERGFALIAILSLAALVSAFLIASALNLTSAGVSNEREQRSMNALRQAKAALIAYAASEQWQLYKSLPSVPPVAYFQPGALPCPDQDNDGDADCFGSLTASMIGRLPFKTLGIDDLRDASGERLWYALSHDFRKLQCPGTGCTTINSDTQGQLTVIGTAPATQVVAIVFAPGEAIQGQNRDPANANNPLSYLEGPPDLSNPVNYVFTTKALPPEKALPFETFNDRVLVITQAELMAAVEPVVAARMGRDIKPYIQNHLTNWGIYPYAALFDTGGPGPGREPQAVPNPLLDRTQSEYQGASGLTSGLLPLTTDSSFAGWDTSTISVTQILPQPPAGTGSSTVTSVDCSGSTGSQILCRIDYSGGSGDRPDIQLQATLRNVARSFLRPAVQGDRSITDRDGNPADWSTQGSPALTPTVSNTLQVSGNATVIFVGRLWNAATTNNRVFITVSVPYNPITSSVDATSGWFIANQWYRQTYYTVSPGHVLGGSPACPLPPTPPTSSCLTVNNLPAPSNNNQVILVFAGRALNGSTRPSGTLGNYLEGQNSPPADLIFEHRAGTPTAINDRVVVVAP